MHMFSKKLKNLKGASLAEYGILLGLIAVVAIFSVSSLGFSVRGVFGNVSSEIEGRGVVDAPAQGVEDSVEYAVFRWDGHQQPFPVRNSASFPSVGFETMLTGEYEVDGRMLVSWDMDPLPAGYDEVPWMGSLIRSDYDEDVGEYGMPIYLTGLDSRLEPGGTYTVASSSLRLSRGATTRVMFGIRWDTDESRPEVNGTVRIRLVPDDGGPEQSASMPFSLPATP